MSFVTQEEVRSYMMDRVESDNPLLAGELRYTPEEIFGAMKTASREYNSVPPLFVSEVTPDRLPDDTNIFFDAIAAALLRATLVKLAANDIQVQAGNVTTQIEGLQINHIKGTLLPMFDQRFRDAAVQYKQAVNLASVFGNIGGTC